MHRPGIWVMEPEMFWSNPARTCIQRLRYRLLWVTCLCSVLVDEATFRILFHYNNGTGLSHFLRNLGSQFFFCIVDFVI